MRRSGKSRRGLQRVGPFGAAALLTTILACSGDEPIAYDGPVDGWPHVGGSLGGARFSAHVQVDRSNVARL